MSCDAPNLERIFAAFEHRKLDGVPNFEILIEDTHTRRLLGREVGHTLGSAKGASEDEYAAAPLDARDYIEICRLIGRDALGMEALRTPLKKKGDDGRLHIIADGSVRTWEQLDRVVPHSRELDIEPKRRHLREYVAAAKGTGIGVTIMTAAPIMTPYQFIVGFEEFMVKLITDRDFIEKTIAMCMDYYLDIVEMACEEGVSFVYVREHIERLAGNGGYILTTSHSVTNDIPFENFMAMIKAGHRFGRYPLGKDTRPDPDCCAENTLKKLSAKTAAVP